MKIIFRQDVIGWNGVGGGAWQMHAFPVPRYNGQAPARLQALGVEYFHFLLSITHSFVRKIFSKYIHNVACVYAIRICA